MRFLWLLPLMSIAALGAEEVECTLAKPTLYQYFTGSGIMSGLTAQGQEFQLNGKDLKILSGSLHYFRVHPDYWRTRLRQYRAAGLNAIDVYVPWNLHEPERGVFDFGDGGREFSDFLDLPRFLRTAAEEDLLVIFRPGPYICGEWEFGGLPSWLLHDHPMYFRQSFSPYQERAAAFLHEIDSRIKDLQFYTANGVKGGPIIMVQIENEYGNYGYSDHPRDKPHLKFLKTVHEQEGIESLFFTSDSPTLTLDLGNVDYVLMTANFKRLPDKELDLLKNFRPNSPLLVSEFWPGWFDHWFEQVHNSMDTETFRSVTGAIFSHNASINFYMFHGGTNFGFMNGANVLSAQGLEVFPHYAPDVTSYDYDAPLTEYGGYTDKYEAAVEMIADYDPLAAVLSKPARPSLLPLTQYATAEMTEMLSYQSIISQVPAGLIESHQKTKSMEQLDINNGNGQSYGYIVYRKEVNLQAGTELEIRGHSRDLVMLLANGILLNEPILAIADLLKFGSWAVKNAKFTIPDNLTCSPTCTLDIMVENLGRVNFGSPHNFNQKKGLWEGDILLDGEILDGWQHIPLEMKPGWLGGLSGWQQASGALGYGPKLLRGSFEIPAGQELADTYFDYDCSAGCQDWLHGAVWINGFNIGRYWQAGPQKTLYIPGALLHEGSNEVMVFETYGGANSFAFTNQPNYGPPLNPEEIP